MCECVCSRRGGEVKRLEGRGHLHCRTIPIRSIRCITLRSHTMREREEEEESFERSLGGDALWDQ